MALVQSTPRSSCVAMAAQREVFICGVARTPIGNINGSLASLAAPQLGAVAIREALRRARVAPAEVQEVFMGNVLTANAARAAGIPDACVCTTVNKVCASGAKAIILAAQSIMLGTAEVAVAGGMESMSNAPYLLPRARAGMKMGHGEVVDAVIKDGLWDPYGNVHMGICAEQCSREHGIGRAAQDAHATESYARAAAATTSGAFADEMVAVEIPSRVKGAPPTRVTVDESAAKGGDAASLAKLAPAFQRTGGTVTAGNASGVSDGAAALVLASAAAVARLGLTPLARIRGWGEAAQAPELFTTAPAIAIPKALLAAHVTPAQVDYYEINEAFSVVALANQALLQLDPARLNVYGGAVALGHPIGSSGARIVVTLLSVLARKGGSIGCAAICNGGGGASAIVVERMPQARL